MTSLAILLLLLIQQGDTRHYLLTTKQYCTTCDSPQQRVTYYEMMQ